MGKNSERLLRAFEQALYIAPMQVELFPRANPRKTARKKRLSCIYDHAKDVYKVPKEYTVNPGDGFLLVGETTALRVEKVEAFESDGVTLFWEVKVGRPKGDEA